MKRDSIVFIHGLFMNPACWSNWITYFEESGYACHAVSYPYHDGMPKHLRDHPDPRLAHVTFDDVVSSVASYVRALPQKPLLIGHSMGGLVVQKLIESNIGAAGICIEPAAPSGILSFNWRFIKAHLPTVNPFMGNAVCIPSLTWVNYAIFNTMTLQETRPYYDQFIVPESRAIPRTSLGVQGKIDFEKPHHPLLFIAGEQDNSIPTSLVFKNFKAYRDQASKRDFYEFTGRTHGIGLQQNWREVATFIREWINAIQA